VTLAFHLAAILEIKLWKVEWGSLKKLGGRDFRSGPREATAQSSPSAGK